MEGGLADKRQVSFKFASRPFSDNELKGDNPDNDDPFGDDDVHSHQESDTDAEAILFSPWERVRAKKSAKARSFLIEMVAYLLFIVLFCLTTFALRSQWTFWSAESVRSRIKINAGPGGFFSVSDTAAFYTYMEEVFIPNMYPTHWYNGYERTSYEQRFAGMHERLVGTTRLRQIRVNKNVNCRVTDKFRNFVHHCYPPYDDSAMSQAPFGPPHNRTKFLYSSTGQLCAFSPISRHCESLTTGKSGQSYPSSGFVVDLPLGQEQAMATLQELKNEGFVDFQTRAVTIDFTLYNANTRLLVVVQMLVEWLPTGSLVTKASIKPTPSLSLETTEERAALALEIILACYLFCYLVNEVTDFYSYKKVAKHQCIKCKKKEILNKGLPKTYSCIECRHEFNPFREKRCGRCLTEYSLKKHLCWRGYFQDPWHWLDVINLIFFVTVFGLRFQLRSDLAKVSFNSGGRFQLMFPIAGQFSTSNYLNSVNALLCFIKTFKYLGKFEQLSILIRTLSNSRLEIAYFLVIFAVIFIGFALAFQLGFGSDVEDYRSFTSSLMSLFRMLLGEFDYISLENSNRVLAPLFFTFYNVLVLFVLSNMFIAIVSGAYATAMSEPGSDDEFLSSSLKLFFNNLKTQFDRCIGKESMLSDILILIERLEELEDLTTDEKGDVTIFRNEVEHHPEDNELFNFVLSAFDRRVNREMNHEDFLLMKFSVSQFKQAAAEEDEEQQVAPPAEDVSSPPLMEQPQRRASVGRRASVISEASVEFGGPVSSTAQMIRRKSLARFGSDRGGGLVPMMSFHQNAVQGRVKLMEDNIVCINNNIGLLLEAMRTQAGAQPQNTAQAHNDRIAERKRFSLAASGTAPRSFSIGGHGPKPTTPRSPAPGAPSPVVPAEEPRTTSSSRRGGGRDRLGGGARRSLTGKRRGTNPTASEPDAGHDLENPTP